MFHSYHSFPHTSFIAVEPIDGYYVLISSKVVYFLKQGDYVDREGIFLEVKYDDLYHCLVSKDHGKVYVQLTKKAENTSSGIAIPGPSHQKPMVRLAAITDLCGFYLFTCVSVRENEIKNLRW